MLTRGSIAGGGALSVGIETVEGGSWLSALSGTGASSSDGSSVGADAGTGTGTGAGAGGGTGVGSGCAGMPWAGSAGFDTGTFATTTWRGFALTAAKANAEPHPLQNLAVGAFSAPHFKHLAAAGFTMGSALAAAALQSAPHALQNFALSELKASHFGQFIGLVSPGIGIGLRP